MLRQLNNLFAARRRQFWLQYPNITDKLFGKFWNGGLDTLTVDDFARCMQLRVSKRHIAFFGFFQLMKIVFPQ